MDYLEKRKKKHAKHHKHKKGKKRSSSESQSSSEEEWVEPSPKTIAEVQKRDDWMNVSDLVPTFSNHEIKSNKKKELRIEERQLNTMDRPGQHERELNPYWKDGGRGLPNEKHETTKVSSTKSVGDGGLDWLRRAYKRVMDQAEEEGKTAEEVAAERWGSLDNLRKMLAEAEEKTSSKDKYVNNRHSSWSSRSNYNEGKKRNLNFQKPRDESEQPYSVKSKHTLRHSNDRPRWQKSDSRCETDSADFKKPNYSSDKPRWHKSDSRCENDTTHLRKSRYSSDKPRWLKSDSRYDNDKTDMRKLNDSGDKPRCQKESSKEKEFHLIPDEKQEKLISPSNSKNKHTERTRSVSDEASPSFKSDERTKREPIIPEPLTMTKKEMNDLGAKIIKAELLGNTELAEKLKAKLNAVKEVSEGSSSTAEKMPQVVTLTKTNSRGLVSPLVLGDTAGSSQPARVKTKSRKLETHRDGERVRYFQDDGKYTLQQMFEREKFTTADDETALYLKIAGGRSKITTDDDFTVDDALLSKQPKYEDEEKQDERQKYRAIKEHKQMASVLDKCCFCLDSKQMQKHLIAALGSKVYLGLPSCESLVTGHCYIVPMVHAPATTHLDEDVWEEVQLFRKNLTNMFRSQEQDVVFMETSLHLRRHPHALIECIPLPIELGAMAPMYFKKAILECDTEWAQNTKLVDLSQKGLRRSVPKGLPYFAVDFGLDGGFAHVVEDEQLFPNFFGREILGGMLDLEPQMWHKPAKQNFKDQSQKVLEFEKMWKEFDCTAK